MPSDAAGWAVAEMKRLLTSRRMSERDAVQAACRRASAMKTAAGALASLASSSDGIPASLVKYVAELTTTDMSIDSGIISRCRTWLTTNKHELMKCKTPLAMIASAAPIVDASINKKAKALDPTLTEACHAALKLMAAEKAAEEVAAAEGGFGGKGGGGKGGGGKGGGGKGKGGGRVDDSQVGGKAQVGSLAFKTAPLDGPQWGVCIALGFGGMVWQLMINIIFSMVSMCMGKKNGKEVVLEMEKPVLKRSSTQMLAEQAAAGAAGLVTSHPASSPLILQPCQVGEADDRQVSSGQAVGALGK